jgi:hypothetical protein
MVVDSHQAQKQLQPKGVKVRKDSFAMKKNQSIESIPHKIKIKHDLKTTQVSPKQLIADSG